MMVSPSSSGYELLFASLDPTADAAAAKYEDLRLRITKILCWKGCPESRADSLADETIDRIADKLSKGEIIQNINSYAAGVVRFVYLEYSRKNKIDAVGDDLPEVSVQPDISILKDDEDERLACLRKCLWEVAPGDTDRRLIIGYYDSEQNEKNKDNRKHLAKTLGMTVNTLKVRACRLRAKLERCINDCVAAVTKTSDSDTINRGGNS